MTCLCKIILFISLPLGAIGGAPRGFGDLGRMAIYFQGSREHCTYFRGAGEQGHSFGDLGSPAKKQKKKKKKKREKPPFCLIFKHFFCFWGG